MSLKTLIKLANQDLLVLEEMEWNGILYDFETSRRLGNDLLVRVKEIHKELSDFFGIPCINWNSPDHVSAVLYGGVIKESVREPYEFKYKDGRTKIKERTVIKEHRLPRLVEPIKGSQLAKEGYWSTAEDIMRQLRATKAVKKIINKILELSLLQTKVERYYHGIPKKYEEKKWQGKIIHGQLNQVVARTGRLSSSDPNMQNMDGEAKQCFVSRFERVRGLHHGQDRTGKGTRTGSSPIQ